MSLSAVDLFMSFWGVANSFIRAVILYVFWPLELPCFDFPSTVILIYPYNFMSAFTYVLIERLPRESTSFLYLANLHIEIVTCSSYWEIHEVIVFRVDVWWNCPSRECDHTVFWVQVDRRWEKIVFSLFNFEVPSRLFEKLRKAVLQYELPLRWFTWSSSLFYWDHLSVDFFFSRYLGLSLSLLMISRNKHLSALSGNVLPSIHSCGFQIFYSWRTKPNCMSYSTVIALHFHVYRTDQIF